MPVHCVSGHFEDEEEVLLVEEWDPSTMTMRTSSVMSTLLLKYQRSPVCNSRFSIRISTLIGIKDINCINISAHIYIDSFVTRGLIYSITARMVDICVAIRRSRTTLTSFSPHHPLTSPDASASLSSAEPYSMPWTTSLPAPYSMTYANPHYAPVSALHMPGHIFQHYDENYHINYRHPPNTAKSS